MHNLHAILVQVGFRRRAALADAEVHLRELDLLPFDNSHPVDLSRVALRRGVRVRQALDVALHEVVPSIASRHEDRTTVQYLSTA